MQIVPNWCEKCEFDERDGGDEPCVICTVCGDNKPTQFKPKKPPSNADRIRSMTDEELAELWWERVDCGECPMHRDCRMTGQDCKKLALDWLGQEISEERRTPNE